MVTKKPGWSHVGGSTMPDTPIETLSKVLDTQLDCDGAMYAQARAALEEVVALVAALAEATEFLHLAVLTLAIDVETEWGKKLFARLVTVRQHNRTALTKFTVKP